MHFFCGAIFIVFLLFFCIILQFIQYCPRQVFKEFASELCEKRRRGDIDSSQTCISCAAKGVGVSISINKTFFKKMLKPTFF